MMIQVELSAEEEARLAKEAHHHGVDPSQYAGSLLKELLTASPNPSGKLSVEEVRIMLEEIAKGSENLPNPPTSSFTRESFYEDRI